MQNLNSFTYCKVNPFYYGSLGKSLSAENMEPLPLSVYKGRSSNTNFSNKEMQFSDVTLNHIKGTQHQCAIPLRGGLKCYRNICKKCNG